MENVDEKYIRRCIQLARNGIHKAAPNPLVGAVIVYNDKIIGEGYHICCGQAHAEVNAINSVIDKELLKYSTLYVTLEPCSHHGKTPPCADLIIKNHIPKVIIGCSDPFSEVSGRGIQKLKDAGIEVKVGILKEECEELIRKFITFHLLKRPYIILKWAESQDGYIDHIRSDEQPFIFSTPQTNMLGHKKRADYDAIMVGKNTVLSDNPTLNVRNWKGKNPIRIVLDRNLQLAKSSHIYNDDTNSIIFNSFLEKKDKNIEYIQLDYNTDILLQILKILHTKDIQTLLVEGGSKLLQSFIDSSLWDEAHIEKCSVLLKGGIKSPTIKNADVFKEDLFFNTRFWFYRKKHKKIYKSQ